jgi:hypothetical protein
MQRYGFGRFRVTQKADPLNPTDVYRTDLALRGDWVMLGNHDTPPIWRCVDGFSDAKVAAWTAYLAPRLGLAPAAIDRAALPQAMFTDLFACAAGRIGVFFADLFGMREVYNSPGVVSPDNWTLRAPRDFAKVHAERAPKKEALDVIGAMSTALRARGETRLAQDLQGLGV